jgi:hypothetical protein
MRVRLHSAAVLTISAFLFGQMVAVAHACPLLGSHAGPAKQVAVADRMPADCAGMAAMPDRAFNANACDSHCSADQQIDVQVVACMAPLAPQAALTIRAVDPGSPAAREEIWLSSLGGAPPLSLLFGHFLI